MISRLAQALQKPEHELAEAIEKLESRAAYPSEDINFLNKVGLEVRSKIAELGLDVQDTTSEELYHSLLAKFGSDGAKLDKTLGINTSATSEQKLDKAVELIKHIDHQQSWSLRPSAVKSLLQANLPKKTLKLLGYRSVDSMFKHEPPLALYFAASQVESKVWQQKTATLLKKLGSQNYEMRPASVIKLSAKYNNLGLPEPLITAKSTGVLAALPSAELCQGSVLAISAQIISALNKFKLSSAGTDQLAKLHPALRWWSGTDHLVSLRPDHSISLNIADVAANHARAADYGDHGYQQGADSLWQNLLGRYEKLASDLHGQVESKQLAPEYAEVQ